MRRLAADLERLIYAGHVSNTLDGYFELVRYELTELVNLAVWQVEPWPSKPPGEATLRNAVLEAELVHARCLLEFLLNKDHRNQSVVARNFTSSWSASDKQVLERDYKRICDHLSHLSKIRTTGEQERWDVRAIVGAIIEAMEDLAANLAGSSPYADRFRTMLRECRSAMQRLADMTTSRAVTTATASEMTILGSTGLPASPVV